MGEDAAKQDEEKLEFDSAGQAIAYISLGQARVLAMEHARDNGDFYRHYANHELVWEVGGTEETGLPSGRDGRRNPPKLDSVPRD